MLSTREAIRIGRRGGRARAQSLSPQWRSEIGSWARLVCKQRDRGDVTVIEQAERCIRLVRAENTDLANVLKLVSRMPKQYSDRLWQALTPEEQEIVERAWQRVLSEGNR